MLHRNLMFEFLRSSNHNKLICCWGKWTLIWKKKFSCCHPRLPPTDKPPIIEILESIFCNLLSIYYSGHQLLYYYAASPFHQNSTEISAWRVSLVWTVYPFRKRNFKQKKLLLLNLKDVSVGGRMRETVKLI